MTGFLPSLLLRKRAVLAGALLAPAVLFPDQARAEVVLSEFMASNDRTLKDDFGEDADWIELFNTGKEAVNLAGWRLTDRAGQPSMWVFPEHWLGAGEYLVVFASGRNRRLPGSPLHTNFSLSAGGEYLGLLRPDGTVATEFAPFYPPQLTDISYGLALTERSTVLAQGAAGQVGVPTSGNDFNTNFANWKTRPGTMSGSSWQNCRTGIGFDSSSASYGAWIHPEGDIGARMKGVQTTACLRLPFDLRDPQDVLSLSLRMRWDDGFIAYLNGVEVARDSAPSNPAWNSLGTLNRSEPLNNEWTVFPIDPAGLSLRAEGNLLAIHAFNITRNSSDLLILPELDVYRASPAGKSGYFRQPTPGTANTGSGPIGPALSEATTSIPRPPGGADSPAAVVSVRVAKTLHPVSPGGVRLFHRTMFGAETVTVLRDDGVAPDETAADGVFTGLLPTSGAAPGQMLRWRFEAVDSEGNTGRAPVFLDPDDYDQYYGTVAADDSVNSSLLPVIHQFIQNESAAATRSGTRCSLFYLDRFYDNVFINLHGQSSQGFPKKSHNFDFNADNRFTWSEEAARKVKDVDILSNYADKTRVRNTLSHEVCRRADTVHHFAFPVRVQRNGAFHGVCDMMEDGDDRMLERNGLDPGGALYKSYDALASSSSAEKKTRKDEDRSDLKALITGLDRSRALSARRAFAYDHVDLPATVNYLAVRVINNDRDHGHKNYYVYRDTNRTREWRPIVWDVDLSWGHNWSSAKNYFDDDLINNSLTAQTPTNRLYAIVWDSPELRTMYLRRLRTLMDEILQPPGTADGWVEAFMRGLVATIDPDPADPSPWTDGDLDFNKWGTWGRGLRPREETEYVIANFVERRREFLYDQAPATRPRYGPAGAEDFIPDQAQVVTPGMVVIDSLDFNPASGRQEEEYVILRNTGPQAVDLSGWTVSGAIDHTFPGGTVIPPGDGGAASGYQGLLHLAKDAYAFRQRASGPTGGQMRLVQGNYHGQLSARGETLTLRDSSGRFVADFSYPGAPTAHQQALRITEIQYHPAPLSAAESAALPGLGREDFEYLEITNFGDVPLALGGATFTAGITFTFPELTLAPGQRIVLAKDPAAFAVRYPEVTAVILGPYDGQLDNSGERLQIIDPVGEVILDFTYKDTWYPATDGSGRSLVLRDPETPYNEFGNAGAWSISGAPLGSPGEADEVFAQTYQSWLRLHFSGKERDDPSISGPDADPDGDGIPNLMEYALAGNPRQQEPSTLRAVMDASGCGLSFNRPALSLDLDYQLEASSTLDDDWVPVSFVTEQGPPTGTSDIEEVILRETVPADTPRRFYRLRITLESP